MQAANVLDCPFCNNVLDDPQEIKTDIGSTFSGGRCACGAVFAYDRSGHNLGEAYVDVLAYACNYDWDRAWSLVPEEDYEIRELSHDRRRNRFTRQQGRNIPTFLFIRLKKADEKNDKQT